MDLSLIRIHNAYVPLDNDIHISAISRLNKSVQLKPQTAYLIEAKLKNNPYFGPNMECTVDKLDKGFLYDQPEIELTPIVTTVRKGRFPIQIVNNSNKIIRLRKGCIVGKISQIKRDEISIDSVDQWTNSHTKKSQQISDEEFIQQIKVSEEHKDEVGSILLKNRDVFAFSDNELGTTDLIEADIDTGDHKPINVRPYRIPLGQRQVLSDTIDEMLESGIIRPSMSPWGFPVILVEKKADLHGVKPKPRVVVDLRRLNAINKGKVFPLPYLDDTISCLKDSTYFTSLDMRSGFHQIKLTETSAPKCSFSTFKGKYEYTVMPFGLNSAPAIFQKMATKLIQGLEEYCIVYIDDILVHTKSTAEDHMIQVQKVLNRIRKHNLKLKLSKCAFLQTEIKYLGFILNRLGIKPDPEKVKAIRDLQPPKNVRQVRGIIGITSWYRRFLPNFSEIASPLIELTKKYARFKWDEKCQKAFEYLKESLSVVPILAYPDPNEEYILYTDSSDYAVGAVLVQKAEKEEQWIPGIPNEKPIYFLSQKLSPTLAKMSIVMKEAYAIHYALNKLDYYLRNAKVRVRCDHQPLKYLLSSEQKNRRLQAWALTIGSYNCQIEYLKGSDNVCADLLSRRPNDEENSPKEVSVEEEIPIIRDATFEIATLNSNQFEPKQYLTVEIEKKSANEPLPSLENFDMKLEQEKDKELTDIKTKLEKGNAKTSLYNRYIITNDISYYISQVDEEPILRLYIPEHLRDRVMTQYHEDNGHMSVEKLFYTVRQKYYWPGLYKDVYKKLENCVVCKVRNLQSIKAPVQTTGIPPFPMAALSLDLSGPYRKTLSGNIYIATFVDIYSGWPEAFPIPDKQADTIVNLLLEEMIPRHSCPLSLATDNGGEFVNKAFKETLEYLNIVHITTSYYSPRGNTKTERSHATLHSILAKLMSENEETWDLHINTALSAMRCNVSKTTQQSPFYLLYNREPVLPIDNILRPRRKYEGEDFHRIALENQHKTFLNMAKQTKKAKEQQAVQANKNTKDQEFKLGDFVYYKNHNKSSKLQNNWLTHHVIVRQTSPVSFVIRNQLTGREIKAHANSLIKANLEWKIPKTEGKPIRKATLAESPPSSDDEDQEEDSYSDASDDTIIYNPAGWYDTSNGENVQLREENNPTATSSGQVRNGNGANRTTERDQELITARVAGKRKIQILENSDEEEDAPLAELQKRFRFSHDQNEDDDYPETEQEEDQYSYDEMLGTQLMGDEDEIPNINDDDDEMYAEREQENAPTDPEFEELNHVKKKPIKNRASNNRVSSTQKRKVTSEQRPNVSVNTVIKSNDRTHKNAAALCNNPKPNMNQSQKIKAVLSANPALLAALQEIL